MLKRLSLAICLMIIWSGLATGVAQAEDDPDEGQKVLSRGNTVYAKAWKQKKAAEQRSRPRGGSRAASNEEQPKGKSGPSPLELQLRGARAREELDRKVRAYQDRVANYEACVDNGGSGCAAPGALDAAPLGLPDGVIVGLVPGPAADPAPAPAITITPQQAAYIAVARLTLTPPTPGIGPPPSINKWKMAAVGYPLWLWAEGNITPAPSSDSVAGLSVSLRARVDRIVFLMGDGRSRTCQGVGTRWTRATKPGAESPTCGYRYEKPSLPKSKYTVTAQTRWLVDWTVNGVSGSIPIVQEASTQLPVGELQSLVR